jgi:hypothetical protein
MAPSAAERLNITGRRSINIPYQERPSRLFGDRLYRGLPDQTVIPISAPSLTMSGSFTAASSTSAAALAFLSIPVSEARGANAIRADRVT